MVQKDHLLSCYYTIIICNKTHADKPSSPTYCRYTVAWETWNPPKARFIINTEMRKYNYLFDKNVLNSVKSTVAAGRNLPKLPKGGVNKHSLMLQQMKLPSPQGPKIYITAKWKPYLNFAIDMGIINTIPKKFHISLPVQKNWIEFVTILIKGTVCTIYAT